MAGVLKLCRKSAISLFLLVIMGSLTLKNVDKRDGYILSDVSELFVAKSLSMETTQPSTVSKQETGHDKGRQSPSKSSNSPSYARRAFCKFSASLWRCSSESRTNTYPML